MITTKKTKMVPIIILFKLVVNSKYNFVTNVTHSSVVTNRNTTNTVPPISYPGPVNCATV